MSSIPVSCLLLALFVVATNTASNFDSSLCARVRCGAIGPAICAKRNKSYQIFPHNCSVFRKFCDEGEKWKQTRMVKCYKSICPLTCPVEYNPVCATDGVNYRLFENDCAFMNFSCQDYKTEWVHTAFENCNRRG